MEPCESILWNADDSWLCRCVLGLGHEDENPWHQNDDVWTGSHGHGQEHIMIKWKENEANNENK